MLLGLHLLAPRGYYRRKDVSPLWIDVLVHRLTSLYALCACTCPCLELIIVPQVIYKVYASSFCLAMD